MLEPLSHELGISLADQGLKCNLAFRTLQTVPLLLCEEYTMFYDYNTEESRRIWDKHQHVLHDEGTARKISVHDRRHDDPLMREATPSSATVDEISQPRHF